MSFSRSSLFVLGGLFLLAIGVFGAGAIGASAQESAGAEQFVTISAPDHEIPAVLALPAGEGPHPAVLLIHGFASEKDEVGDFYKRLAAGLAQRGYASLRFDFPGSGDSTASFTLNNIPFQEAEAARVFDYLANLDAIDEARLGVVGFSLGGIVGVNLAAEDDRVQALALWSTPGDVGYRFIDRYEAYYAEAKANGFAEVDLGFTQIDLSAAFLESTFASYPLHDIQRYNNPLLVIAGEEDDEIPGQAPLFVLNSNAYDATMLIVPGADHIFNVLTPDQSDAEYVLDATIKWLGERL